MVPMSVARTAHQDGHDDGVPDRLEEHPVGERLLVPVEGQARDGQARGTRLVEREEDEQDDGRVEEAHHQHRQSQSTRRVSRA